MSVAAAPYGLLVPVSEPAAQSPAAVDPLAARLAADVDAAFPDLFAAHESAVYGLALRTTGPNRAEDLAAETFLRAYAALRRYPADQVRGLAVRPWLVTILLNVVRNEVRSARRRPAEVGLADHDVAAHEPGPERVATAQDTVDRMLALVRELPERQRLAVLLRHVGELGYAEIAAALGVAEGTAKSDVSRGLQALRARAAAAGLEVE